MKTIRFSVPFRLHTFISFVFFALLSFSIQSQTISGHVYDACTGAPLGGATVNINVNIPGSAFGNWNIDTYPDGSWDFSFFGGDPVGPYIITVKGGDSSPNSYTYSTTLGNMAGFDFDLLPDVLDVTINGEEISWQNNPLSPHTVCENADNCLGIGEFAEVKTYCFKVSFYKTNKYGEKVSLLEESDCINFGRPNIGNPCGDPNIDLNQLLDKIEEMPKGSILMEVQQFCCESECQVTDGTLVNTVQVYIELSEIGPAQACFMMIDDMGLEIDPGDDCVSSLSYCQIGVTLDGSCSSGQIDRYWIVIDEYDLNTCDFIRTLADGTANPTSISSLSDLEGLPLNTYVSNHWAPSSAPIFPYFFTLFTGNPPANYEVTLYVENDCGIYSTTGWFDNTISTCLTGGGDDSQSFLIAQPPGNSQNVNIDSQGYSNMVISPNPSTGYLKVEVQSDVEGGAMLLMLNTVGEVVLQTEIKGLEKGNNTFAFDVSDFPDGLYYISLNGQMGSLYSSFVKN